MIILKTQSQKSQVIRAANVRKLLSLPKNIYQMETFNLKIRIPLMNEAGFCLLYANK